MTTYLPMPAPTPELIQQPRYSSELTQLFERYSTGRHELYAVGSLDVLFIPEHQLAYVVHGNTPANRYSVASAGDALSRYEAQRLQHEFLAA